MIAFLLHLASAFSLGFIAGFFLRRLHDRRIERRRILPPALRMIQIVRNPNHTGRPRWPRGGGNAA